MKKEPAVLFVNLEPGDRFKRAGWEGEFLKVGDGRLRRVDDLRRVYKNVPPDLPVVITCVDAE